ncbi:helix-turn-helix domain-containing protein [Polaribacter sp. R2A056_3_33]|uniref:helix-turn-helix domain-containing protein n=1 Tax=Polaribacter sp. R2A056_3_33 TaxID=2745563 RepID=UPI001C4E31A8|nr:helix-turn-helix domain-containing protein [Polaribacter sp. R2A056_3_33]QXP71951.1 helix-turn-helix domain-containing protein [Polaribacter sp. R2A056_3_33]
METKNLKSNNLIQALFEDFSQLNKEWLTEQFENLKKELSSQNNKEDLMTREQVLELLQINPTTLWHWQNSNKITVYKFANKNYYKRSEILEGLKPLKKIKA